MSFSIIKATLFSVFVVFTLLLLFGQIDFSTDLIGLIILSAAGVLIVLVAFGLVGPRRLREPIRKWHYWLSYKSALFFPMDPYKDISAALKEGAKNFLPTGERLKNWVLLMGLLIAFLFLTIIVSIIFVVLNV